MIMHTHYTTSITLQSMIIAAGSVPAADNVILVSTNQGNYLRANRELQMITNY